ncbi:hypothetical protein R5R35_007524 [Gryllus longicercus]|uniref:Bifunctional lysine-specific demethylase and histidyl-hydroxylase n=1 Tax=Gryllus longicercus TaxID=2509291 RepID=A0AAN9VAJ8_9ORTH
MSPSKPLSSFSAYEVEMKRRKKLEARKLLAIKKNKTVHDGKRKDKPKVLKEMVLVKSGKIANIPNEEIVRTVPKGNKKQFQNKKKKGGKTKESSEPMDDEYVTEEEESIQKNGKARDVPMRDESGTDSIKDGRDAFSWLIAPIKPEEFFQNAWERAPLHVKRTNFPDYYREILTSEKIHNIIRDNYILFSKNIDVTSYRNGKRETLNPPGRATPSIVWDFYNRGCSVRMLNPQTFCPELRKLNASLQDFFGCFVGANSYLTPANSQGFAPHYDDIEAFILQLEGKKHWKVYAPRKPGEVLPRFSSPNFTQEELQKPVLEVTLHPGDFLYFPRGFIHQASTEPGHHSLHLTVSCYQKNSWGDLLEKLLPAALAVAQEEDVEFRKGLPLNYLRHAGVSNSEQETAERQAFFAHLQKLLGRLMVHAPVDAAVDQMGKQFMHDALPPVLTTEEEKCSVFSEELLTINKDGRVSGSVALNLNTKVKLLRSFILRLVKEDDSNDNVQVYHCVDNSLEYHGEDPMMFEVSSEFAMAVEQLIHSYPEFISVSDLALDRKEDQLELADLLWKKGLLLTEKPLA